MLGHFDLKDPKGEPLNVIVSSESSPDVLQPEGFLVWATALGQGDDESFMYTNLGKENPNVRQGSMSGNNGVLRWNYGIPSVGTCRETIQGGNHFRWDSDLYAGIEWKGNRFNATVRWVEAGRLLNATSENINHPEVAPPNGTAIDGRVAVLTKTSTGTHLQVLLGAKLMVGLMVATACVLL
ncbi:hypothetical protein MOBT1_000225 [Malassezia obtusa]|uniref:Uncharacterized protein n=1 Tax=Malassezia obtusa TaxID=76774 RepID=A0AAF0E0X9_9BASI|nr:hypothetical protein MOBT1_000225 [Malassezia obtusa]